MIDPPRWTPEQLEEGRREAISRFRRERLEEPLEAYLESFEQYQGAIEDLLETTVDLAQIDENALDILTDSKLREVFRYLAGPPISEDDLKTLAEAASLSPKRLKSEPQLVESIVQIVMTCLDRRRFAWVVEQREPTEAEKNAAVLASAALLASQRLSTSRRHFGKGKQEAAVEMALSANGFQKVATRRIGTFSDAPESGEFCGESVLGTRKGDFVVRLWDSRILPIECKVSNSALNSVKRLNNDAAVKAVAWKKDFGERHVVPAAVLSGVYNLRNLVEAQQRGLMLFWAHDLTSMTDWIQSTKSQ